MIDVIGLPRRRAPGLIELLESRFLFSTTTINWRTVNQTITGIGASSAFVTQGVTNSQSQLLFSTTNGVGLSMLRSRIAEDQTTLSPNTPQAATSWEIDTMDDAAEMNYQNQLAGQGGITIWSTPWSPPAAWKTNQSVDNGGSLLTGTDPSTGVTYYQEYANYLAAYVKYIDNLPNQVNSSWPKISLYGISLQNEPDENVSYESCIWTASEFAAFLPDVYTALNNLQGQLPAGDPIPKIIMPEASSWSFNLASDVLGTSLSSDVGVYAAHDYYGYGDGPLAGLSSSQQLWMTEVYDQSTTDTGITTALWAAENVYNTLVTSGANAYNYWWIQDGSSSGNGELLGPNWSQTPLFWGLGNYSRFIRPGWNNIGETNSGGLTSSAYADTATGAFATVLVNASSSPITETINLSGAYAPVLTPWVTSATLDLQQQTPIPAAGNGASFTYTIPAQSIVTLTGTASTTPVTAPPAGLTVIPSGTTGMSLSWTNNVTGATGYTVQRSTDDTNWTTLSTTVPGTTHSYTDSPLTPNTLYYYRVIANNGSVYSNVSYALTLPSPVTNLTANYSTSTLNVTLNWSASSTAAVDYEVERSSNGGSSWTELTAGIANGTTTYTDMSAPQGESLRYEVLAINGANSSAALSVNVSTAPVGVGVLTLNGVAGNNAFYLKDSAGNLDIWINAAVPGSGTPTQTVTLGSFSSIVINGGSGNNKVTLDYSGGDPTGGDLSFNGSSATNTITIQGETGGVVSTLAGSSLTIGSDSIGYMNLQGLNLDLGSGSSVLTASDPGVTPALTLSIDAGATVTLGASSTLAINTIISDSGTFNLSDENESVDQITGNGTVTSSGNTLVVGANNGSSIFAGTISGGLSLDKTGSGSFSNTGDSSYSGNTTVDSGTLTLAPATGSSQIGSTSTSLYIAPTNASNGTLNLAANVTLTVGGANGGVFLACNNDYNNGGGIGLLNQSGGTLNVSSGVFYMGGGNGTTNNGTSATWNLSGGTANLSVSLEMSLNQNSISSLNISGCAQLNLLSNTSINLGQYYTRPATITQTGGGITFFSDAGVTVGGTGTLDLNNGGGTYIYSLAGGTLTVPSITTTASGGSATINFSGGTLVAAAASGGLIGPGVTARIRSGGATINSNGQVVTIGVPLIHDASLGSVADGGLTKIGSGTLTLSSTSTYTGLTNVSGGTVTVSGAGSISKSGGLIVGNGASFDYLPSTNGTLTLASGSTLNLSTGSTVGLTLGDKIAVLGAATVGSVVNLDLTGTPASGTGSSYPLLGAALGLGSASQFQLTGSFNGFTATISATGVLVTLRTTVKTSTVVTSNVSSGSYGQSITFTAAVIPSSGSGETGTVQFFVDGTSAGGMVLLVNGVATYATAALTAGNHSVVAVYSGDGNFSSSSSAAFSQNVVAETLQLSGTVYLEMDPATAGQLDVWMANSNATAPAATFPLGSISNIVDEGTSGNESFTADFTNGDPLPAGGVSFDTADSTGGSDSVVIIGDHHGDLYSVSAGQMVVSGASVFAGAAIAYSASASIQIVAGGGADQLTVAGDATVNYVAAVNANNPTGVLSALSIAGGSKVMFSSPTASRALLQLNSASNWAGMLDLESNDLLVNGGSASFNIVNKLVDSGYAHGNWNGAGITSSSAALDATHLTALGAMLNDQNGSAIYRASNLFDGIAPAASDVLVRYTYYGDANLDGKVDGVDYSLIDAGYQGGATGWLNGDFNDDGIVDGSDYTLIDNAFNSQSAIANAAIAKPSAVGASSSTTIVWEPWTATSAERKQGSLFSLGPSIAVSLLG